MTRSAIALVEGTPTCPARQLGIVVDRTVISAPSINAPEFERDQISISGGFTQAEAEALAAGLGRKLSSSDHRQRRWSFGAAQPVVPRSSTSTPSTR